MFPAGIAVLGVQRLVAGAAVRSALPHDVTLAAQRSLALKTAEVLHVPVSPLGLRAFIRQNDLRRRDGGERKERKKRDQEGGEFMFMGTEINTSLL